MGIVLLTTFFIFWDMSLIYGKTIYLEVLFCFCFVFFVVCVNGFFEKLVNECF